MYRSERIGTLIGRITGARYRFWPGHIIPAPDGDLYGMPGVVWMGEDPETPPPSNQGVEVIIPRGLRSVNYPVAQAIKMAKNMNPEQLRKFTEGDRRKTLLKISKG